MRIKKEDLDRMKELEKSILSLDPKKHGIKYTPDDEIELLIKESVLIDRFGKERFLSAMKELSMDKKSLSDQDKYIFLTKFLLEK